jgi:hypothetical protein
VTRDEYERSRARLEEQHRETLTLIETAFQAQIRALELVWMLQGGGEIPKGMVTVAEAPPPAAPAKPRRRTSQEIVNDVVAAYWRVPETFSRHDVCQAIGYKPDRSILFRTLKRLVDRGDLAVEESGSGHRPTLYRRTPKKKSDAQTEP